MKRMIMWSSLLDFDDCEELATQRRVIFESSV